MDRYDACFWRNSTMTSFAGSKSWNFCGRRGVNSSTALRTAAGSNEDIGLNAVDVNLETDRPRDSHSDAMAWTGCGCPGSQPMPVGNAASDVGNPRSRPVCGRFAARALSSADVSRICYFRGFGLTVAAPVDVSWTRLRTVQREGLPELRLVHCLSMFTDVPRLWSGVIHIAWLFAASSATASRTLNPCANKGFGLSCIKHDERQTASSVQQIVAPLLQLRGHGMNSVIWSMLTTLARAATWSPKRVSGRSMMTFAVL